MKKLYLSAAAMALGAVMANAQPAPETFRTAADPMEIHASEFIGKRIYRAETEPDSDAYDGVQEGWDDIGEVNDVILSRDGRVEAVLVDIGGFLGMGEHRIAVNMDAIRFVADSATADDDSDFFLVLTAPRSDLEGAPAYEWPMGAATGESGATTETGGTATDDMATAADTVTDATTDTASREPIARDGYVPAEEADLTAEMLTGAPAYDANDERVGEVSQLILSDDGKVQAAVVDVGGFLGIGEKPVQLKIADLDILRAEDGSSVRVYVALTKEQMEALPAYEG